ncbi:MAG: heavy-metal-associated domain-containing protein [Candidimonas sp.]|nr:MAG: heavy-metal-associated domain-containing protein [Candidimonas sp.]TAM24178.1 MAG: heavy-metal-associated domain-containing protein [Candidimonas sp.]
MKNVIFKVHGMHCDGCAQIVQSVLKRREGVQTCAVSFAQGTARVLFDPVRVDESQLQAAIEQAGYQVEPHRDASGTVA